MTLKVNVTLSEDGISAAAEKLRAYAKSLDHKADCLARNLTEEGAMNAVDNVNSYDMPFKTGMLASSITSRKSAYVENGHTWQVFTDCDHASFVEFGTGVVGEGSPYPYDLPDGWEYNSGDTIGQGVNPPDTWHYGSTFTKGMISRPYMMPAATYMRGIVVPTAKGVFQ